jgi:aminoglycoside 3-N-acetyltransferase
MHDRTMDNPLIGYWEDSGLQKGDVVLVHSSMRRAFRFLVTLKIQPNPSLVIDSLLDQIGPNGTLILPLFNFDFPVTKSFSMLTTPSQMGVVTEFARLNYKGVRTGHPIYSFFALGAQAGEFKDINNRSGYGPDSPFSKLLELNGKVAAVDLEDQESMTIYHFIEERLNVSYRYHKKFQGSYVGLDGSISTQEYSLFVRDLAKGVITDVNRMGEILWSEGLYKGLRPGVGHGMRSISATQIVKRTEKEIMEGRASKTLYSIQT